MNTTEPPRSLNPMGYPFADWEADFRRYVGAYGEGAIRPPTDAEVRAWWAKGTEPFEAAKYLASGRRMPSPL